MSLARIPLALAGERRKMRWMGVLLRRGFGVFGDFRGTQE
jgi:hypothetical protein